MVPVTRRGSCTRSRAWPEAAGAVVLAAVDGSAAVGRVGRGGRGASADRTDDEQDVRHSAVAETQQPGA